ncbi:MAG: helix-turn-helix transcriptional regulator [Bifidobacterium thermacidophilum]|jgi:predicted transcriptional regulator|uniref:helix-turn-helix domain-containing protein n=1 Tax=Bifidobacterium thermacidophilum TaxID=246618 RepID=UPI002F35818C
MSNKFTTDYSNPELQADANPPRPASDPNRIASKEFFNLAIRIAVIREGLTLTDTAFRAGIPRTTFYDRLHGLKPWSIEHLVKIANVLFDHGFDDLVAAAKVEAKRVGVEI